MKRERDHLEQRLQREIDQLDTRLRLELDRNQLHKGLNVFTCFVLLGGEKTLFWKLQGTSSKTFSS